MSLKMQNFLICDDSVVIRKQLRDFLESVGYNNIYEACNGQQAIDAYKEQKYALVFMDMIMPIKDGIEAITEIMEFDASAKIIVVSSIGTNNYISRASKAGATAFLQKPVEAQKIIELLNQNGFNT